ncbi:MAG: alanine--tRNA ligase [Polyangiaceae bacterium]|nr:alanine--tRNA ligase [Polyangiaceae bacterium]
MTRTAAELRRTFLDFFSARDHEVVASGPLVPPNDPSLLFANAGMVQFKDVFTGRDQRPRRRATSSQKCIRISGKHNDLEAVGPSPRHHTFFEMLGNFSFGDYFKEEAIVFAWDLLVKELGLDRDRLICTYFAGAEGVPTDDFARDLWKKLTGFGDDRVRGCGMADNFWQMGETGPCGPSSEIYYCFGPLDASRFGEEQTPEGHGWMEIWNLVFMQFERSLVGGEARLAPLPAPSIDTGAGLERLASVVQGETSNYHTDLLLALVERAAELAGKRYGRSSSADDTSCRVIADHARTTAFLIAEGILPDRAERAYVLRRVMRRAIRHGHRLGIERPFLHEVTQAVVELMGADYPELTRRRDLILSVTEQEEVRFRATIERGLGLLDERFAALDAAGTRELAGGDAFMLYDTYGFPVDLTRVIAEERGYTVDEPGYEAALEEARRRSDFKGAEQAVEGAHRDALALVPGGEVRFSGYDRDHDTSAVVALLVAGQLVERIDEGAEAEVVVSRTPFYAESGGQVGDSGEITGPGASFVVRDTQRPLAGLVVHRGVAARGSLALGDEVRLCIDAGRREATRRNHSATHLLHLALRGVVGEHAQQKGSLVGPDRLRFDFTSGRALSAEELGKIEDEVNRRILLDSPVVTEVLDLAQARERGAVMIFEEKYGDVVRMLTMGDSVELCGGTHARSTGELGLFKITSEQGVAAGVRRIQATTGLGSLAYVREVEGRLADAAARAKTSPALLGEKLERMILHERALEKKLDELERKVAAGGGLDALLAGARDQGGFKVLGARTEVTDRSALRELAEQLRDKLGESIVLLGSVADDKAQLVLTVSKSLAGRFPAGQLIRPLAAHVGGSGGGRPDMAQAGGTEIAALDRALAALHDEVAKL